MGFNGLMMGAVLLTAPLVIWLLFTPGRGVKRVGRLLLLGAGAVIFLRAAVWLPEVQRLDPGEELTLLARAVFGLVGLGLFVLLHLEELKEA